MMRVLALLPALPYPPYQGASIRNFNLLRHVADRCRIHLLCFGESPLDVVEATPLRDFCELIETLPPPAHPLTRRLRAILTSPLPDMAFRLRSPLFQSRLERLLEEHEYDVVHVGGMEMAPYALWLARKRGPTGRPALVLDEYNAEYVLQRRAFEADFRIPRRWPAALYSLIQWQKLRRYEAHLCRAVDRVIAVSENDAIALRRLVPDLEVEVIPNGVDVDSYARFDAGAPPLAGWSPFALVFTGKMDFRPNVDAALWFARRVLPLVRRHHPQAHFYVVGRNPHPRLRALSDRPGVTITGFVKDVRPYIAHAAVYVVPIRVGGGTRLKVLEAMAMRKAVVSTSLGCEGYPVQDGVHLLVADEAEGFAEAIRRLFADAALRERLGRAAFEFVRSRYRWESLAPRLLHVYAEVLNPSSKP